MKTIFNSLVTAMVETWLPYGRTEVSVKIPIENLLNLIEPEKSLAVANLNEEILRALNNPLGTKLEEKAQAGANVAIVVEDEFLPNSIILPPLFDRLNSLGIKDEDITIIIGGNFQSAEPCLRTSLIGEELHRRVRVVATNVNDEDFIHVGDTSRNTRVCVKKEFAEADLKILTGRIGFHPFAGYVGGRSGVLSSVCGRETFQSSYASILDSKAKVGNLEENPLNQEMEEAAHLAKANFVLNVALDAGGKIVGAFAGEVDQAFLEARKFLDERFRASVDRTADIVILSSGGNPWDVTLSGACQGLALALNVVKQDGVIVWIAECSQGAGSSVFHDWMSNFKTMDEAAPEIKKRCAPGGDAAYLLLKTLRKAKVVLVSVIPNYYAVGTLKLRTGGTANAALKFAFKMVGGKSKVLVLPNGITVLPSVIRA